MNDLEIELIEVGNRIDEAKKIHEVERLFSETKKKWENTEKGEFTEKIRKLSVGNFVFVIYKLREFYDNWGGSEMLNAEELNAAERIIKEIFKVIDKVDKADFPPYFSEKHRSEAKKGLIAFRLMIDEAKVRLKVHLDINKHDRN